MIQVLLIVLTGRGESRMLEILIVDDDADIRESLKLALELEGYHAGVARHGGDAWGLLDGGARPALVLLDLAMPVVSGAALLARIRGDARLAAIPVVVLTAFGALPDDVGGLADGCLLKPVDLDAVLALAARFCAPRAATAG
jgi:two-component system, chemotaxis family, chemotaxis protein CheY